LELLEDCPQLMDHMLKSSAFDLKTSEVDPKIAELLLPQMEKRSGIYQYLKRKAVPQRYKQPTPYSTPLTISDPASGQRYMTTRGAAIRAHDEIAKRNLYKSVGGAALLGGAYKLISSGLLQPRGLGALKPLVAGTLAYLGYKNIPSMGQHYMTDQGVPIPVLTEMSKTSSASSLALPLFGTLGLMALMGHDYTSRLQRGEPVGHPAIPLSRRVLDKVEQFSMEHPILTAGVGTLALRGAGRNPIVQAMGQRAAPHVRSGVSKVTDYAQNVMRGFTGGGNVKMSAWLGDLIPEPTDTVVLPPVNFDKIAERIGEIIVEA